MPRKVKVEKKVSLLIPKDPLNPDIDAIRFQRDGVDFFVPLDEPIEVPLWVKESAIQSGYIKK
ncbi:MAG: hypothetical protein M0R51_17450 [Clostridia bacterium]|jgi:hypothetical protein|nr:hypothetical protein [Clostridia bacterium]